MAGLKAGFAVLKTSLFFACLGLFINSAFEALNVHQSGLKTMTSTVNSMDPEIGLLLPVLLICNESGFKNTETNTKLLDYMENTMSTDDLDIKVAFSITANQSKIVNFTIHPIHTAFKGRCYALQIWESVKQEFEMFIITLRKSHTLKIFALEPGSEILAAVDIWFQRPLSVTLRPQDTMVDLYVEKTVHQKMDNCNSSSHIDFYDNLRIELREHFIKGKVFPNCTTPWTQYLIYDQVSYNESNPCSQSEASTAISQLGSKLLQYLDSTKNNRFPCETVNYKIGLQSYDIYSGAGLTHGIVGENSRAMYFYYQSTSTVISKEILVMGFYDLISAWGGTLGLFMGISLFSSTLDLINLCEKFCQNEAAGRNHATPSD